VYLFGCDLLQKNKGESEKKKKKKKTNTAQRPYRHSLTTKLHQQSKSDPTNVSKNGAPDKKSKKPETQNPKIGKKTEALVVSYVIALEERNVLPIRYTRQVGKKAHFFFFFFFQMFLLESISPTLKFC
jgi:hypothetical protein